MGPLSPDPSEKKKGRGRWFGRRGPEPGSDGGLIFTEVGLRDPETGLPNSNELQIILRREIARGSRYGHNSALAVFEFQLAAYQPTPRAPFPPSPANFIATTLIEAAREGDVVARLGVSRFAVLLSECSQQGAENFANRARTRLSTPPYARTLEGKPLFVRSWAGSASWAPDILTPEDYVVAAVAALEATYAGYERARSFFGAA
jgi:GGDEF domain-containing protein